MKTTKILIIVYMAFAFSSCMIKDSCGEPIMTNNSPDVVDWENYNEVGVICCNTNFDCRDPRSSQYNGKTIKVCGWIVTENDKIIIREGDSTYVDGLKEYLYMNLPLSCTPEIQSFFETQDLTRKCYLKGEFRLKNIMDGKGAFCCQVDYDCVILKNLDDIYFE